MGRRAVECSMGRSKVLHRSAGRSSRCSDRDGAFDGLSPNGCWFVSAEGFDTSARTGEGFLRCGKTLPVRAEVSKPRPARPEVSKGRTEPVEGPIPTVAHDPKQAVVRTRHRHAVQ